LTGRLVALDLAGGPAFVDALRRVWDRGDAALPVDQRLPAAAREDLLVAMSPSSVLVDGGDEVARPAGVPVEPGDALVVATSGTTGTPRGVVLTHDAVRASALSSSRRLGVTADDHWLACIPLSHVGGLSVVTRALVTGCRLTVHPGFDPVAVQDAGATLVSLVPTALRRVDPMRFRTILLGGSRPPDELPGNVVVTYGLTESGSGVVYDGIPLDDVEVRVAPDGAIALRGPQLLRAYRDGTDPRVGGWFETGDVGAWDDSGRLVVHGRRGDLIVSGGENVWPEPVEAILRTHPAVADVAVMGVDDAEWGQIVTALIVPSSPTDPPVLDALRAHVKASLPAFHAPRRIELVERIPRTSLGKIARHRLGDDE
jgi:O-succinylbenzoic acid--CoA ligase